MRSPQVFTRLSDPLLCDFDLPLRRSYYPYGFHIDIESNSSDVHQAAAEIWSGYEAEHSDPPIALRILVQPGDELSPQPVHRMQRHLYTITANQENFACVDFDAGFGYAWVTSATAHDHAWFRWFFLEGMSGSTLAQRHYVPMHAACIERRGGGVMLWGPSGMGKSTLSFACARAGWTFISDDCTILPQNAEGRLVTGKPHQARFREDAPKLFPEIEGFQMLARPTGKLSIEVPMNQLPGLRTAMRSHVETLVFLDRGKSGGLSAISREEAMEIMLSESCQYSPETFVRHERALRRLLQARVYRLRYTTLEEALEALETFSA